MCGSKYSRSALGSQQRARALGAHQQLQLPDRFTQRSQPSRADPGRRTGYNEATPSAQRLLLGLGLPRESLDGSCAPVGGDFLKRTATLASKSGRAWDWRWELFSNSSSDTLPVTAASLTPWAYGKPFTK